MQLNLHVPKDRERLLGKLEGAARRLGRPKNQVVLDALERYLEESEIDMPLRVAEPGGFPAYHMGAMTSFRRADLYADESDLD